MGTLTNNVSITIDGDKYEKYNFSNIVLNQELLRPNELRFTMQKKGLESENIADSKFDVPKKLMGAKVELTVQAMRFDEKDKKTLKFKGIINHVDIHHRSGMSSEQLIDVTAYSPDFLLMDHPHCFSYENDDLKKIVKATLDPYDISNDVNPRTTASIPYTVQYNESNYQFLIRLARRFGEWMFNDGEKWIFGEIKQKDTVELDPRNDITNYHFQSGLMHHKLKHAHHDYLKYENLKKSNSDISDLTSSGYHTLTDEAKSKSDKLFTKETFQHLRCSNPEKNDIDEPDVSIKAQLYGEKMLQTVCTGSTVLADLTIGSKIKIKDLLFKDSSDPSEINHDDLIITSITHSTEVDGHYSNSFTAFPASSKYPPYYQSDIYPVTAAQRAKVKENDDKEHLGRVRVQFLWQEMQDATNLMTPWIRIAQPHGGGNKGFYFIPEIDEEVMVDFENGNAEKPYVVGTLYHGKDHRPDKDWFSDKNDVKAIRTRNGHTIEIHDKDKGGFIRIYDNEKENYVLTFSTDDKLIKLESTGNIELHATKNIKMKADENVEIEAGQKIMLKSNEHEQTAKSTMKLDGGSSLTEKASTVEVKADGTTTIKGSMVQIN